MGDLVHDMREALETPSYSIGEMIDFSVHRDRFIGAMDDDLNIPAAIEVLLSADR